MKFKVTVLEYERGWGQRVDEVKTFDDANTAFAFVESVNKELGVNDKVPDIYRVATEPMRIK